jgi:hypothetical protein
MMREGNLDAPTRHPLDWRNPGFYDAIVPMAPAMNRRLLLSDYEMPF